MALNIGNVNFGVDANTKGLKNAIKDLDKFRKTVDSTAKAQKDGAMQVDKAMSRQESAIKKAFQATLKLQQSQRRAGAPPGQIADTTNAFKRLTTEMTSGKLTTDQFTRAQDSFANKIDRSKRALIEMTSAAKGKNVDKLSETMRNLESASVLAIGPLSGVGARIRSLGAIAGRSGLFLVGMFAGITAGIVVLSKLAAAAV